jgi:hypothetical protein
MPTPSELLHTQIEQHGFPWMNEMQLLNAGCTLDQIDQAVKSGKIVRRRGIRHDVYRLCDNVIVERYGAEILTY